MAHHQAPQNKSDDREEDGRADALAAVVIIAIFVATMSFWLHGMK